MTAKRRLDALLIAGLTAGISAGASTGVSADDQLLVTTTYGYDSNPFKLSSPKGVQTNTEYKTLSLKYQGDNRRQGSATKATLRYHAELKKQLYSVNSSAADSSSLKGHISWIERLKLGQRKANLRLSADIRSEQNTYYSQIQRQIAETNDGDPIDNRFSFDSAAISAELRYYRDKKLSWSVLSQFGQRNYSQDYREFGLEPLDYSEFRLQPGLRYKADSGLNTRLFVYHRFRSYKGLSNNSENDLSLVEYSLKGYGLALSKSLSQRIDASVYLSGYFARDNGQGIRDLDYHRVSAVFNYRLLREAEIRINIQAYTRGYLGPRLSPDESEIGTSGNSRNGDLIGISFSQPLRLKGLKGLKGSMSMGREKERNSLSELGYQRDSIVIGLHYQL